ncbi:MAG: scpB [Ferruginibacter sp.]|nr:scpB [Ferruginibacter sp.]
MELSQIIPHIEALIFASDKPLTNLDLVELLNNAIGFIDDRATLDQVEASVEGIREKYSAEFYAFELKQSGGGWQFLTKKEYHKTIAQLNGDKFLKRLSNAALETLAIIAYKQPITKSEIESIRGVNCDYAVQKLLEKDLVVIAGRNEEAVGKPLIYTTSKSFMDYFGINSTDDLPKIKEVLMDELVQATIVNNEGQAIAESGNIEESRENILELTERDMQDDEADSINNDLSAEIEEEKDFQLSEEHLKEILKEDFEETIVIEPEEEIAVENEEVSLAVIDEELVEEKPAIDNIQSEDMVISDKEDKHAQADKQAKPEDEPSES